MYNKTYTSYFQNFYDDVIVNIESIYEEKEYCDNIIDNIKITIDKYKVKSVEKLIANHIIHITKSDINHLIYYIQSKNIILENDVKNNKYSTKFIFYNSLTLLFILVHLLLICIIISKIYDFYIKLLFISIILISILISLAITIEIKNRYPPIFIQKLRLQKSLVILKMLENIHSGIV